MTNPFKKKIAVGNLGEEELERLQRTVLTREETRAEADLLFGATAGAVRRADRSLLEKLFVQTPASITMAPNLQKSASASPYSFMKLAYEIKPEDRPSIPKKQFAQPNKEEAGHKGKYPIPDAQHYRSALGFAKMHGDMKAYAAIKAKGKAMGYDKEEKSKTSSTVEASPPPSWLAQFEGSSLLPSAIELEEALLVHEQDESARRAEDDARYESQEADRKQRNRYREELDLRKRLLVLELTREKAGNRSGMQQASPAPTTPQPPVAEKTKMARVDAFFANCDYLTDAQKRYPELLKAAEVGTRKVPNIKPRVTTESSGQTPVRSGLAGGSA